ncbi:MAG: low molecular weight phosphatase family protein [Nitratiruptor sp.]|nr:low molecular weight phosphatase family protein [Nitratiruptor sp.]NPA83782.1 arsenate reductase ArsC [Campylobacterota bacterium]
MKQVLVLCKGNSCRSIIAQALIDHELPGVTAQSAGSCPRGQVNPNAKRLLQEAGLWRPTYRSKGLNEVAGQSFDLVVRVCNEEECPLWDPRSPQLLLPFPDPEGKPYEAFHQLLHQMRSQLLPAIRQALSLQE